MSSTGFALRFALGMLSLVAILAPTRVEAQAMSDGHEFTILLL